MSFRNHHNSQNPGSGEVSSKEGESDADKLSRSMGVPVVPMVASRNKGIAELLAALDGIAPNAIQPRNESDLPKAVEEVATLLEEEAIEHYPSRWLSTKLIESDTALSEMVKNRIGATQLQQLNTVLEKHPGAFEEIVEGRRSWIEMVCKDAVDIRMPLKGSPTDSWDRAFLHPVWGVIIAILILPVALGISLGIGLIPAMKLYEVYFAVRISVMEALPGVAGSFLSNGIMLPITWIFALSLILFLLFAVLAFFEDIGFLARITYLSDPLMRRLGLDAKSVIPLFFGFICNACSVLGTRVVETHNRRLQTIAMMPFIPCSAQIMVAGFIAVLFFPYKTAVIVVLGIITANLFFAGLAGKWAQRRYPSPMTDGLIMELPLFHRPNPRTIFISAWSRVRPFITRGATLMLPVMILFWAISYFPDGEIDTSFMARAGRYIEPITNLMGLDWRFTCALVFSFIARENTLTALSIFLLTGTQDQFFFTVHGPEKEAVLEAVRQSIAPAGALAFIVASNFFVPCIGTIGVLNAETKSFKWTSGIVITLFAIAFILAVLTYQIARHII